MGFNQHERVFIQSLGCVFVLGGEICFHASMSLVRDLIIGVVSFRCVDLLFTELWSDDAGCLFF